MAQLLDATFTFFALSVDESTTEYLRSTLNPMAIFLDTNFIFGVLNLHNGPLNEISQELVSIVKKNCLPFTFYYHPATLNEMKRTISALGDNLRTRKWKASLSRAALRNGQVSDFELHYHKLNAVQPIDPEAFIERYEHPEPILHEYGFVPYEPLPVDADYTYRKGEHIAEYSHFIESRRRAKSAAAYDHDVSVWLATEMIRGSRDSILETGVLLLTCDYHLYAFDQMVSQKERRVGGVVLPNHFIQMLRLFIPSTDDFDQRFVETFAIPEFRTIGSDYSLTVSKVLSYLALYSDVSEETAVRILANQLLIEKLKGVDENSEEFKDSIESALMKENEQLLEEVAQYKTIAEQEKAESQQVREQLLEKERQVETSRQQLEISQRQLEEMKLAEEQSEYLVQKNERELEDQLEKARLESKYQRKITARWRFVFGVLFCAVCSAGVLVIPKIVGWNWLNSHPNRLGLYACGLTLCVAISGAIAIPKYWKWFLGVLALGIVFVLVQILGK